MTNKQNAQMEENRKKKIVALMKEPSYVPMKEKELACLMQVQAEERAELQSGAPPFLLCISYVAAAGFSPPRPAPACRPGSA